ncbi:hypothetical protein SAMN04488559_10874 [Isobaculum melis]|uniref:Uncharacterized protein n=1 Tax=Isobaculum melis TaxID=142588 RepID=A0A1H9SP80_9LACT|nr:hypothetical protein SAMN04488559_10874 [Isobaculum melis]
MLNLTGLITLWIAILLALGCLIYKILTRKEKYIKNRGAKH